MSNPDLPERIEGPSAWKGEVLRHQTDWIYRLSRAEIDEIEEAVETVQRSGAALATLGRDDFPLPRLQSALAEWERTLLEGRGFILVRGLPIEGRSIEWITTAFWGIGAHLGNARSQNSQGHLIGHVYDKSLSVDDPNVRVYQTRERQTFHTDSCDVVGLLCIKPAKSGGLSSIVSSMAIYNEMMRRRPDLAFRLAMPFPTDRRGEIPPGQKPYFDMPVFNSFAGLVSVIYARRYIQSSQRFDDARRLEPIDIEALDLLDELANAPDMRLDMELGPGDMQFVHNHTILHDRTGYEDWSDPALKRHLLRLWLAPKASRPLPEYFAARYGSVTEGDRGGIICADTVRHIPLQP